MVPSLRQPRVSVIMGVYNAIMRKEQLFAAVQSILEQSYDDFEFIICDDCSEDGTYKLLEEISAKDKRIILLRNDTNRKLAFTLNRCLDIAKGEYIARMDDDDISCQNRLRVEVDYLDQNPSISLVGSNVYYIDDRGIWGESRAKRFPEKQDFLWGSCFIHPSIMIRKEILQNLGGYSVSNITQKGQDYDLWMRLYSAGYKGANIDKKLLHYRWDKTAYKKRKYKYRFDTARICLKGFKQLGLLPKGYIYALKPLIVGILPSIIVKKMHEYMFSRIQ